MNCLLIMALDKCVSKGGALLIISLHCIYLACINASVCEACTEHGVANLVPIVLIPIADTVTDDRHAGFLKDDRWLTCRYNEMLSYLICASPAILHRYPQYQEYMLSEPPTTFSWISSLSSTTSFQPVPYLRSDLPSSMI